MKARPGLLGLVVAGCVLLVGFVDARQERATQQAVALTSADIVEIQQLAVRYSYAADTGAMDGRMMAGLFAPGGAFVSARGRIEGDGLLGIGRGEPRLPRRFIVNHVVESTQRGVTGRAYVIEVDLPSDGGSGGSLSAVGGRYDDEYVKTEAGWRFRTRRFVPSKATFRPAPAAGAAARPAAPPAVAASSAVAPSAPGRSPAPATTAGQAPPRRKAQQLSAADYVEIQQLVARYAHALDTGAAMGSDLAALFTAGGRVAGDGIPGDTVGAAKLAALVQVPTGETTRRGPNHVAHFMTNVLIEPSEDGALGKVYLLLLNFGANGQPHSIALGGHYEDGYVKTPQGWRFKTREFFRGRGAAVAGQWVPSLDSVRVSPTEAPLSNGSMLSAADYLDIAKLVAHYAYGLDTGADDGGMYADLFSHGGQLFGRERPLDEIRAIANREPHGEAYVRHFLTNIMIEPTPNGSAAGKQYLAVIDVSETGGPSVIFLGGRYEDTYRRTPDGWRFRSRALVRADAPPPSARQR